MAKYINFSIFEIDYEELLETNHNDLMYLSIEYGNTITIRINKKDIDETKEDIRSYIDKDDMSLREMISIINFYITLGKVEFTDDMMNLFMNGPKAGNMLCIFIYTLDKFICVTDVDTLTLVYELFGFGNNFYKYNPLSKDRIKKMIETLKEDITPKCKYIEVL